MHHRRIAGALALAAAALLALRTGEPVARAQWPPSLAYDPAPPAASVVPVWEPGLTRAKRTTLADLFAGLCPVTRTIGTAAPLSGGGALSGDLSLSINLSAAGRLLGRSSDGPGAAEEVEVGAGLALAGGVLSSTGGVSSVSLGAPGWLAVGGSPGTGAVSLSLSAAGSQTADRVLGTCSGATSVALCALSASQLPTVPASKGGTGQTAVTDDGVLVSNGSSFDLKTLPGCADGSGQHLNYDASTNAFSCGTGTSYVLPAPTSSTLGGVESIAAVSHLWIDSISTAGVPHASRPACADVSDAAASCSVDATNASNLSTGTLPAARLPTPASTALGGVKSLASVSHMVFNGLGTDGAFTTTQLSCADLSGAATTCSTAPVVYGAAGAGHSGGLVMDTSATANTPAKVAGDDAAWHAGSPFQDKYHPDRPVDTSLLYTGASDYNAGGVHLSWTSVNSGEGLAMTGEYDTFTVSQTSGTASPSHIVRGFRVPVPSSGNWRLFVKFENEVSTSGGNAGSGQAGIGLGVGGTAATPDHAEFIRVYGQQSLDWAFNTTGNAYTSATNVRTGGTTPSNWDQAAQWVYLSFRYTASTRLIEAFYSFSGYQWVSLGSTTPASGGVPVSEFVWVDANSTTLMPKIRVYSWITRTDTAGYNGASGS